MPHLLTFLFFFFFQETEKKTPSSLIQSENKQLSVFNVNVQEFKPKTNNLATQPDSSITNNDEPSQKNNFGKNSRPFQENRTKKRDSTGFNKKSIIESTKNIELQNIDLTKANKDSLKAKEGIEWIIVGGKKKVLCTIEENSPSENNQPSTKEFITQTRSEDFGKSIGASDNIKNQKHIKKPKNKLNKSQNKNSIKDRTEKPHGFVIEEPKFENVRKKAMPYENESNSHEKYLNEEKSINKNTIILTNSEMPEITQFTNKQQPSTTNITTRVNSDFEVVHNANILNNFDEQESFPKTCEMPEIAQLTNKQPSTTNIETKVHSDFEAVHNANILSNFDEQESSPKTICLSKIDYKPEMYLKKNLPPADLQTQENVIPLENNCVSNEKQIAVLDVSQNCEDITSQKQREAYLEPKTLSFDTAYLSEENKDKQILQKERNLEEKTSHSQENKSLTDQISKHKNIEQINASIMLPNACREIDFSNTAAKEKKIYITSAVCNWLSTFDEYCLQELFTIPLNADFVKKIKYCSEISSYFEIDDFINVNKCIPDQTYKYQLMTELTSFPDTDDEDELLESNLASVSTVLFSCKNIKKLMSCETM